MWRTPSTLPPIGHWQLRAEVICAMWRTHPSLPPSAISSWELKWHVQCRGGLTHPPLANGSWEFKWCVMWRTTYSTPPSAIESWSDICNVEDQPYPTPHWQVRVEVTHAMWRTHSTLPPISHWQLRVEVTCVMWRRTHSPPISSWELKWYVWWGPHPTLPPEPSVVENGSGMCNMEDLPDPAPSAISGWELKWHVMWRPHLTLTPHWQPADDSWSDMCNVKDPSYLPPIGHWQLRVEVTCVMWRTHPTSIGHQQLRVEMMWNVKDPP